MYGLLTMKERIKLRDCGVIVGATRQDLYTNPSKQNVHDVKLLNTQYVVKYTYMLNCV